MRPRTIQTKCSECGCAMKAKRLNGPWYCDACRVKTAPARRAKAYQKWAEKAGALRDPHPPRVCAWHECANVFEVPRKRGQHKRLYCSQECARKAKNEQIASVRRAIWEADRELRAEQAGKKRAKLLELAGKLPEIRKPQHEALDDLDRRALELWRSRGWDQAGAA